MNYRWFLLILIIIKFSYQDKTVILYFSLFTPGVTVGVSLGEPPQYVTRAVDQETPFTWISNSYYNPNTSKENKYLYEADLLLPNDGTKYRASCMTDEVTLKTGEVIKGYNFYYFKEKTVYQKHNDGISLAYKFEYDEFSLSHSLSSQGYIDKNRYTVSTKKNFFGDGAIYFGDFPSEEVEGLYKSSCRILSGSTKWECPLDKIYLTDNSNKNDEKIIVYNAKKGNRGFFNIGDNFILAPKSFIDLLYDSYFKDNIKSGLCSYNKSLSKNRVVSFTCDCGAADISIFSKIYFTIGNAEYYLEGPKLFNFLSLAEDSPCGFAITENKAGDFWIFGGNFIRDIKMTFDYDHKEIVFYTKFNPFSRKLTEKKFFLGINIGLCLLSTLSFLLLNKLRK